MAFLDRWNPFERTARRLDALPIDVPDPREGLEEEEKEDIDIFAQQPVQQEACPLFQKLPPELRSQIYAYALTDYPDPSPESRYEAETCYTRPSYSARKRHDTDLLRTCRAIYWETWYMPFLLCDMTFWLTAQDRAPPEHDTHLVQTTLMLRLARICERRIRNYLKSEGTGEDASSARREEAAKKVDNDMVIHSLRVFTQMYVIEGGALGRLLQMPHLFPRRLVVTIRHADWWFWENDEPLRFEGNWLQGVSAAMPSSVREICIELESLERKKTQVDSIAQQMCARWFFKCNTAEGKSVTLYPDATPWGTVPDTGASVPPSTPSSFAITRWTGSSTWNGHRWTRDETAKGQIDYYVMAVTFRPEAALLRRGGAVSPQARQAAESNTYDRGSLKLFIPVAANDFETHSESDSNSDSDYGEDEDEDEDENEDDS